MGCGVSRAWAMETRMSSWKTPGGCQRGVVWGVEGRRTELGELVGGDVDAVDDVAYGGGTIVDEGLEDGVEEASSGAECAVDLDAVDGHGGEGIVKLERGVGRQQEGLEKGRINIPLSCRPRGRVVMGRQPAGGGRVRGGFGAHCPLGPCQVDG